MHVLSPAGAPHCPVALPSQEITPKPVSPLAKMVKSGYAGSPMRELVMAGESGADRDQHGNTVLHMALMLQKPEDSLVTSTRTLCPAIVAAEES